MKNKKIPVFDIKLGTKEKDFVSDEVKNLAKN